MPPKPSSSKTETVKVVVRCRPMSKDERKDTQRHKMIVDVDENARRITVENIDQEKKHLGAVRDFTFDSVFSPNCKQQAIFEDTALPIIESVLEGYNGTIFAYGQTGTGKTFTMEGEQQPSELKGIVPRSINYIFEAIAGAATTKKHLVRISFLELYNEQLIDLLSNPDKNDKEKKKLEIHQRPQGIKVVGLSEFVIENEKEITHRYNNGKKHRKVAMTKMNAQSSRSHSIFTIIIENQQEVNGRLMTRAGKLNLVDLAGSERQKKTGVSGEQRQQAININLSLTTLGLVIQNLVNPKSTHIPYRDSQLTRMLQDSLGGNTKTVMIANIGPSSYNHEETLSTLKYANRAKNIKNDVKINEDPKDALLRQFQQQIKRLKQQVAKSMGGVVGGPNIVEKIIQEDDVEQFQEKMRIEQQAMKKKFQDQKADIYKKKNMIEEQKNKLIKAIQEKERQQALFRQNQDALIKKLKKMEEKVLCGKEEEQAALEKAEMLRKKLQQLQEKRQNQRLIQEGLKQKEENIAEMEKKYKSLQEENDDKTQQIKQKAKRLKNLMSQNKQLQEMYAKQIQQLQQRRRLLQKQLKLKNFIIDYFVPGKYIEMINDKVAWSDDHDDWILPNLGISGNSLRLKNPQTNFYDIELTEQQKDQQKLNQLCKAQLDNPPNVYYEYNENGLTRELNPILADNKSKKNMKKRPQSKKKT